MSHKILEDINPNDNNELAHELSSDTQSQLLPIFWCSLLQTGAYDLMSLLYNNFQNP